MTENYPLAWPVGYPRSKYRESSRFGSLSFGRTRDGLIAQIRMLVGTYVFDIKKIVISTNIPLRQDGLPMASFRKPTDPGVAIYFYRDKKQFVFACDRWNTIEENMWAIAKTIEAIRGIERWGSSDMIERAFTGFKALPEATKNSWWEILGVAQDADEITILKAYRMMAKQHHPDSPSGNAEKFIQVRKAYEEAMKQFVQA